MKEGPQISIIASLIGDPARANMLTALMDGRALTASELAAVAGITKQTASTHLAKLSTGNLLVREVQGRHHYFRLKDEKIAHVLETLMSFAEHNTQGRVRVGPKDPALRKARICYDHLAGEQGVFLYDALLKNQWLYNDKDTINLTSKGQGIFEIFGIDIETLNKNRRPICRTCLDWSMRRHHLAGGFGAILSGLFDKKWIYRDKTTRIIHFNPRGETQFKKWLT
ncbi:MAG: transcriptional regulator [Robiginitomaculum sp.]|nr:MAG: transcriptional regulator [Robiginitomaculum sp.]